MNRAVFKKIVIFLLCIIMVTALFACTPRVDPPSDGIDKGDPDIGDNVNKVESLAPGQSKKLFTEALANTRKLKPESDTLEYFTIELSLDLTFIDYTTQPKREIKTTVDIKANLHLLNNAKSELFVEIKDKIYGIRLMGVYYYDGVGYVVIGTEQFYIKELNMSSIGALLGGLFITNGIDINSYIEGLFTGRFNIEAIDSLWSVIESILFDPSKAQMRTYNNGASRDIGLNLKINEILGLVKTGLPPVLGIGITTISWEAFGLPDLDPLMMQFLGFSLGSIKAKEWPKMECYINAVTKLADIPQEDGTKKEGYYYEGLSINVTVPETNNQKEEYYLDLKISPLQLGVSSHKINIDYSGLGLGAGAGSAYKEAGLLNLDLDAVLYVEGKANSQLTINNILGDILADVVDLGAIGNIPIKMPSTDLSYEFKLNVKTDIDLFDPTKTRVELSLWFQDEIFIRGYLEDSVLYLDLSKLKGANGQIIPNLKVTGADITTLLRSMLGEEAYKFLDPNATILSVLNSQGNKGGANYAAGDPIDPLELIAILVNNLTLPGPVNPDIPAIMSLYLDYDALEELLTMFADGTLGVDGIGISMDLRDPLNTININIDINEDVRAGLKITRFGYFKEPIFDNSDIIDSEEKMAGFVDIMTNTLYNAEIGGKVRLGMTKTDGGIDLDGIIGLVSDKLLGNLGLQIKVLEEANLTVQYKLLANVNILNIIETEFNVSLYLEGQEKPFLIVYYNGIDDALYLNLRNLHLLKDRLPALKIIGDMPDLKIPNLGLAKLLAGLVPEQPLDPQNGLNNILMSGITLNEDPAKSVENIFSSIFLSNAVLEKLSNEDGNAPIDIMDLIGQAIDGIYIDNQLNALSILVNAQILTVLMGLLGQELIMPEVTASLKLQLVGNPKDGYINLNLGIRDSSNKEIQAFNLNFALIDRIGVYTGKIDVGYGEVEENKPPFEFINISDFAKSLIIGVEVGGNFSLTSDKEDYTNEYLNGIIEGVLKGLALKFNFGNKFAVDLEYTIKGNININNIAMSQIEIKLIDKVTKDEVLALYLLNGNAYLVLDYFGIPNIGLTNVGSLLSGLASKTPIEEGTLYPTNIANLSNKEAIALQVLISRDRVAINITKDILDVLLAAFGVNLPISIKDTKLEIVTGQGVEIKINTGVEVLNLSINLGITKVSFKEQDLHKIALPADKVFNMTENGIPKIINLSFDAVLNIHSDPVTGDINTIDLSPALRALLPAADLNAFLDFWGVVDGSIFITVEAALNLSEIANSTFKVVLSTETSSNSSGKNVILTAIYSEGDLYLDTGMLGIGKVVVRDIVNAFPTVQAVAESNNSDDDTSGDSEDEDLAKYLEIMFVKGGIGLTVTKDILLTIFGVLGADMSQYLEGIDLAVTADIAIHPVEIDINIKIGDADAKLSLNNLKVGFDKPIELPNLDGYKVNERLDFINITLNGSFKIGMPGNGEGIRLDYLIQKLLVDASGKPLVDLGVLLKVLGKEFGGTVLFSINASIDLTNINNLQLSLKLYVNDILTDTFLSLYILGNGNSLDLYLDAEKLGLEKIKIHDVQGLVGTMSGGTTGQNNAGITPIALPVGANGRVSDRDILGANIILSICSDQSLQEAPIILSVTSAAIFALVKSFGIDLEEYLAEFKPGVDITLAGSNGIINIQAGLDGLIGLELALFEPEVKINESPINYDDIKNDNSYYTVNNQGTLKIKVGFEGKLVLTTDPTNPDGGDNQKPIDLTPIILSFFKNADFGAVINAMFKAHDVIYYKMQVSIDIIKLVSDSANAFNHINAFFHIYDEKGNTIISILLEDGKIYADLTSLNIGKVVITDVGSLIKGPSAVQELMSPLNEESGNTEAEKLAAAYIELKLGNSDGLVITVFADVFKALLSALNVGGDSETPFEDVVLSVVNRILEARVGVGHGSKIFDIEVDIASYKLQFGFEKVEINLQYNEITLPKDFDRNEYGAFDSKLSEIYLNLNFDFGWDLSDGAEYSFEKLSNQLLGSLIGGMGMDLAPVLSVLGQISNRFRISVEAILNIKEILTSDIKIALYPIDGSGVVAEKEALSLQFIKGDLYLDLSCFNIQKVVLRNAVEYFTRLLGPSNSGLSTFVDLANNREKTPGESEAQKVSTIININYTQEGLIANVTAASLFAILQLANLDIAGYFDGLGSPNIIVSLLTKDDVLKFELLLRPFKNGETNEEVLDKAIGIHLAISKDFKVRIPEFEIDKNRFVSPNGYAEIEDEIPIIGIGTSIVFDVATTSGQSVGDILKRAPLNSLLTGAIAEYLNGIQANLIFGDNMNARIELEVKVNINPTNILALKAQVNINAIVGNGELTDENRKKIAQLNVYEDDMYIDLTPLNGPKFCIEDIFTDGSNDSEEVFNAKYEEKKADQINGILGKLGLEANYAIENSKLEIQAQIRKDGLFAFINKKTFFNPLLGNLLNFQGDIDLFSELEAELFVKLKEGSLNLGLNLYLTGYDDNNNGIGLNTDKSNYMVKVGFGLEGVEVNFEQFSDDEVITPQFTDYLKAHTVNTIETKLTLEAKLGTRDGEVTLDKLFKSLLGTQNPLATTLPNKIYLEGDIGDTLIIELHAIIDLTDILGKLQIRAKISSKTAPDKFSMEISYYKGSVYLDLEKVGFSKIKIDNIIGLFGTSMSQGTKDMLENAEDLSRKSEMTVAEQTELIQLTLDILINKTDGLLLSLTGEIIGYVLNIVGVDATLEFGELVSTKVEIGVDPNLRFHIDLSISGVKADEAGNLVPDGGLDLGFAVQGSSFSLKVHNNIEYVMPGDEEGGISDTVKPVITKEERLQYLSYDKLSFYTELNFTFSINLDEGRLGLDQVLDLLLPGMKLDLEFKGNEEVRLTVKGKLGVDLAKLLSKEVSSIKEAITAEFNIGYSLYDRDNKVTPLYHEQEVAHAYFYNDVLYLKAIVLGATPKSTPEDGEIYLSVDSIGLGDILAGLLLGTPPSSSENNGEVVSGQDPMKPYTMLRGAVNNNQNAEDKLRSAIYLNSHGLSMVITTELINSLLALFGLEQDVTDMIGSILGNDSEILDHVTVGAYFDDGFSLRVDITNKPVSAEDEDPGLAYYKASLTLFHDTVISTDRATYTAFLDSMQTTEMLDFYRKCFDIKELNNTISASLRIKLDANFKEYLLNWSELFKYEYDKNSAFFIKIAEAMRSTTYIDISVGLDFTKITDIGLDIVLTMLDAAEGEIMKIWFEGSLNNTDFPSVGPKIYVRSHPLGIDGVQIDASSLQNFIGLDLLKLLGLSNGNGQQTEPQNSYSQLAEEGEDDGFIKPSGELDFTKLLDSISIAKGTVAIVIAQTAIQSLLKSLLGFPFSETGDIKIKVDIVNNSISLDFALDKAVVGDGGQLLDQNLHFLVEIGSIYLKLGPNDILAEDKDTIYQYPTLDKYKFEVEVYSELAITDEIGGIFDLTSLTSGFLPGLDIALQSGEDLNAIIGFKLKAFIDFGDITNVKLQLEITYNKKTIIMITFVGGLNDSAEENGIAYVDLSGMGMPAVKLENLNIGGLLKDMVSKLGATPAEETPAPLNSENRAGGFNPNTPSGSGNGDMGNIADVPFGIPLLLIVLSSKEASIAITGALVQSLLKAINNQVTVPMFHSLKIGYDEAEGLSGIVLTLTSDEYSQAFKIRYDFLEANSQFSTNLVTSIDPLKNSAGEKVNYESIDVIQQISLGLDVSLRLRTKKSNGEKSDPVIALENLIGGLMGANPGAINLDLQDSTMEFNLAIRAYVNLKDFKKTALSLVLSYGDRPLLGIYFYGETNQVYADLAGVGLFQAVISGIDILGMVAPLLGGFIEEDVGLNLGGMLGGLFGGTEEANQAANSGASYSAMSNAAQDISSVTEAPVLKVIIGNTDIVINPSGNILSALIPGLNIPAFSDIRLTLNTMAGLNNLDFKVKLDGQGNNVSINVPEGGLKIKLGSQAEKVSLPGGLTNFSAISGVSVGTDADGNMTFGVDIIGLATGLLDNIKLSNLAIYLDKRNDYWQHRDLAYYPPNSSKNMINGGASTDIGPVFDGDRNDVGFQGAYFKNAFRRLRITANKTSSNQLNLYLSQLTQLAKENGWVQGMGSQGGEPMEARAFIRDHILRLSLYSALTFDLTPILRQISGAIIDAILGAIGIPNIPGLTDAIKDMVANVLATLIGEVITDYGNPLRLGKIIDDFTGGGIEILRMYLPEWLPTLLGPGEVQPDFGTVYGKVVDSVTGNPVANANVHVADAKNEKNYQTLTDKDGNYCFINIVTGSYKMTITKDGFEINNETNITVIKYLDSPATKMGDMKLVSIIKTDRVEVTGRITIDEGAGVITPFAGLEVSFGGKTVSTNENGDYTISVTDVIGDLQTVATKYGGKDYALTQISTNADGAKHIAYNLSVKKLNNIKIQGSGFGYILNGLDTVMNSHEEVQFNGVKIASVFNGSFDATLETYFANEGIEGIYGTYRSSGYLLNVGNYYSSIHNINTNNQIIKWEFTTKDYQAVYGDFLFKGRIMAIQKGSDINAPVVGLDVYVTDQVRGRVLIGKTNGEGQYEGIVSGLFGSVHTIIAGEYGKRDINLNTPDFLVGTETHSGFDYSINNAKITGTLGGRVTVDGTTAQGSYELWLQVKKPDGNWHTIRLADSIDGTTLKIPAKGNERNIETETPRNYMSLGEANFKIDANGNFLIMGLALDREYRLKFRSMDYENKNVYRYLVGAADYVFEDREESDANTQAERPIKFNESISIDCGHYVNVGEIKVTPRKHWSKEQTSISTGALAGMRIRLGADILDGYNKDDSTDPGYNDAKIPNNMRTEEEYNADQLELFGINQIPESVTIPGINIPVPIPGVAEEKARLRDIVRARGYDETFKMIYEPVANMTAFEQGAKDRYNNVSYVEIWLDPAVVNNLFSMLHGMLLGMCGMSAISPDQRYYQKDLVPSEQVNLKSDISMTIQDILAGNFDKLFERKDETYGWFVEEKDKQIFDYKYESLEDYSQNLNMGLAKLPAGIIGGVLGLFLPELPGIVFWLIQTVGNSLIADQLDQVTRLLSHALPFTLPYSMSSTQTMNGNPLNTESMNNEFNNGENVNVKDILNNKAQKDPTVYEYKLGKGIVNKEDGSVLPSNVDNLIFVNGGINDAGQPESGTILRDVDYYEKSVHLKVVLNNNVDTFLDRISININGASYKNASNGFIGNNGAGDWTPNATRVVADVITFDPNTGAYAEGAEAVDKNIKDWIRRNTVNSYIIVEDYQYVTTEEGLLVKRLAKRIYIRDIYGTATQIDEETGELKYPTYVHTNGKTYQETIKDDFYHEIEINNTGIRLRATRPLNNNFFNFAYDAASQKAMMPPDKIVFHDPFDPTDFTVYGGTWATELGDNFRRNADPSVTIDIALPNRNRATFKDGNSEDSEGIHVFWDKGGVKFNDPKGTSLSDDSDDYFIVGYVGSQVYGKDNNNVISKIRVDVEGLVIDPASTFKLDEAGRSPIVENTDPLFNLPKIDLMNFNEAEYTKKNLPSMFTYDYKKEYYNGLNNTGFRYKRVVFNQVSWSFKNTEFKSSGGTHYVELTYGYKGYNTISSKTTIKVPVEVLPNQAEKVNAKIPDAEFGIVDSVLTFNPLIHKDLEKSILKLKMADVTTIRSNADVADGYDKVIKDWKIEEIDVSELNNYNPDDIKEQVFTIYLTFVDIVGIQQKVPVKVVINSREIYTYMVEGDSKIYSGSNPYTLNVKPFSTDEKEKITLPKKITVNYLSGISEIKELGKDYTYTLPEFSYSETKAYNVGLTLGKDGDIKQNINMVVNVEKRVPKKLSNFIIINPYQEAKLKDIVNVDYNDIIGGISQPTQLYYDFSKTGLVEGKDFVGTAINFLAKPGKTYYSNVTFNNPSFDGKTYFVDVLMSDAYFGLSELGNVSITLRKSLVSKLNIDNAPTINPFESTKMIKEMLDNADITLSILQDNSVKITKDYYSIVGFRYKSEGGLDYNIINQTILVTVGNVGYNVEDPATQIWSQEVLVDISTYNYTLTDTEYSLTIDNPYDFQYAEKIRVNTLSGEIDAPAYFDLGKYKEELYKNSSITVPNGVRIGSNINNYQYLTLNVTNNSPRIVKDIKYINSNGEALTRQTDDKLGVFDDKILAFDQYMLPSRAKVSVLTNGTTEEHLELDIWWTEVDKYTITKLGKDVVIQAKAKIGNPVFGYIEDTFYLYIEAEWIISNNLPNQIIVDPYKDIQKQLDEQIGGTNTTVTTNKKVRNLTSLYPELQLSYEKESIINTSINVGITTNFGVDGGEFEAREYLNVQLIILERNAVGIKEELIGSIYERIDFSKYSKTTVLFSTGAEVELDVTWSTDNLRYTFLGGNYTVYGTIGKGTLLQQTFAVNVGIRPSQLRDISVFGDLASDSIVKKVDGSNVIEKLVVDPFKGFIGLPNKVLAKFDGRDDQMEVFVKWNFSRIASEMSIGGGTYDKSNNMPCIAEIYVKDDKGNEIGIQSLEVPVEVLNKSIIETTFAKDKDGEYVTLNDSTVQEENDSAFNRFEMVFNPYSAVYSENFTDAKFAYYRYIKVKHSDNTFTVYELSAKDYVIYDKQTKIATNTKDLYKGRSVLASVVYGNKGASIAKDAFRETKLDVTIQNMTYIMGANGGLKERYDIDVYGIDKELDTAVKVTDGVKKLGLADGEYQFEVIYDKKDVNNNFAVKYINDEMILNTKDKIIGTIGYKAGVGRLYAKFGNELGGFQEILIPVVYQDRTVNSLFDGSTVTNMEAYKDKNNETKYRFKLDPYKTYDEKTFYVNKVKPTFNGVTNVDQEFSLTWDTSNMYINFYGGTFSVTATLGKDETEQKVIYPIRILDRTVVGYSNVIKNGMDIEEYKIQPYKYNGVVDLATKVTQDIFINAGSQFTVSFREGDSIIYTLGSNPTDISGDIVLSEAEKNLIMSFRMDTSRPISSTGKKARFYISIPGYGMGRQGQQQASIEIGCEEQYIVGIDFKDTDTETYNLWEQAKTSNVLTEVTTEADGVISYHYNITNPYYFIKQGGLKLPDEVMVYVGPKEYKGSGKMEQATYQFKTDAYWSNSINNKMRVNYVGGATMASFRLELDNQIFNLYFNVTPWIIEDDIVFSQTSRYGEQEIILLPKTSTGSIAVTGDHNENYTVTFAGGKAELFYGIKGGGTYANNLQKWSFDDINFNASSTEKQYATMTLGGKGGQQVRWQMYTTTKHLVNNSISNQYVLRVGESITLPTSYKQIFSGDVKSTDIALNYGLPTMSDDSTGLVGWTVEKTTDGKSYIIKANNPTPSKIVQTEPGENGIPAQEVAPLNISWRATEYRAYPKEEELVGQTINFVAYTSDWGGNNGTFRLERTAYIYHPDSNNGYTTIRPSVDPNWLYPSNMSMVGDPNDTSKSISAYGLTPGSTPMQKQVPVIKVKENTMMYSSYLPNYTVNRFRAYKPGTIGAWGEVEGIDIDYIFAVPWYKAEVYYTNNPYSSSNWYHGATPNYGTKLKDGLAAINTGADSLNKSRKNGRYTLVATMLLGGREYKITVAIDIV